MMRKEYIAGLEEIRKRMIEIGQAFAAVDMTDATGMERNRRKKTAKLVGDLADRLYEDIAISAKVAADKAEAGQGEQDDLFDTAPEAGEVVDAEEVEEPAAEPANEVVPLLPPPASPCKNFNGKKCKLRGKTAPCANGTCDGLDCDCPKYEAKEGGAE